MDAHPQAWGAEKLENKLSEQKEWAGPGGEYESITMQQLTSVFEKNEGRYTILFDKQG